MPFPTWTDIGSSREKETNATPLVSIFGGGIAGLSLAHELVERGMAVQVFEAKMDPDEEYSCQVGGLAANQLARIPAHPTRLHPYLYPEQPGAEEPTAPIRRSVLVWILQDLTKGLRIDINGEVSATIVPGVAADIAATFITSFANAIPGVSAVHTPADLVTPDTVEIAAADEYEVIAIEVFEPDGDQRLPSPDARWERVRNLGLMRSGVMQRSEPRFPLPYRLQFERVTYTGNVWLDFRDNRGINNHDKLAAIWTTIKQAFSSYQQLRAARIAELASDPGFSLSPRMRLREELCIELRGHADGSGTKDDSRALAKQWVESVRDELLARNTADGDQIPTLAERIVPVAVGDAEPLGNARTRAGRRRNDRVEVRIIEDVLPAEHGYRYFPCFYRHLFDTMRRTPILDAKGRETGETAFDQLVSTPATDVALSRDRVPAPGCRDDVAEEDKLEKSDPEALPTGSPLALEDVRTLLRIHLERMNICERDILQFQFRLLKFLTASDERRRAWERMSWLEFLGAHEPGRYSERMVQLLMDTPQALLAMNAAETDAHTQGLIYCQLLLDALTEGVDTSRTLNGPTSQAWLDQWKRYLRRQGVRFFNARLESLDWTDDGELIPTVSIFNGAGPTVTAHLVDANSVSITINGQQINAPMPGLGPDQQIGPLIQILRTRFPQLEVALPDPASIPAGSAALPITAKPRSALLTIETAGPMEVVVNGASIPVAGATPQAVRDHLLASLHDADFDAHAVGTTALRLGTNDPDAGPVRAMVSVRTAVSNASYGIELGSDVVQIQAPMGATVGEIRNQLIDELVTHFRGEFVPLGSTGIRIDERWLPYEVSVAPWEDLMGLGPVVEVPPGAITVEVVDVVSVSVHSAVADIGSQGFVSAAILPGGSESGGGSDFYVLAVPYEEASRLVWEAWEQRPIGVDFEGVFHQLMQFDQRTGRRDDAGAAVALQRDASGRPVPPHWPLRDLSGIQLYFDHQVRLGNGHTYYVDSPWGLSSVSQLTYWRQRMSQASPFLGQVSVDIGHWYRAVERKQARPDVFPTQYDYAFQPEAWHSTRREIAEEVWRQLLAGSDPMLVDHIVAPTWYHIDEGIRFEPVDPADRRRAFSRLAIVAETADPAPNVSFRLGDTQIDVPPGSSAQLAAAIEATTDHLAHPFAEVSGLARVAVAPVARQIESVRVVVVGIAAGDQLAAGVPFRVSVNLSDHPGTVAAYTSQPNDGVEEVRQGIVAAVMSTLPGVVAELEVRQHGEDVARGIRLRSTWPMRVSVLALDGETPLLWTNPTGGMEIEPLARVEIEDAETSVTPIDNTTPFLINTPDRKLGADTWLPIWQSRPGIRLDAATDDKGPFLYEIELGRWLMVGNHMATHTRLSTMESANESARHAAISILHVLMQEPADPQSPLYNGQGSLHGRTPQLWPPAEHEVPDARPFKRLDQRLMTEGFEPLPHFLDILKIGDWIDGLPQDLPPVPEDDKLQDLLEFARKQVQTDWRFTQIDELQKLLPAAVKALIG